ncbi:MAG: hypothetical protein CSA15_05040 [Candidatus Delongbacteria bacterium]|nr:MAG: hypothetical protein CSA15_05040 [Candidatus Delongbacteria bacterium]
MFRIIFITITLLTINFSVSSADCSKEETLKLIEAGYSKKEIKELCNNEESKKNKQAEVLKGSWRGYYSYPSNSNRPDVPFQLIVTRQDGNSFNGLVKEPRTFGNAFTDDLSSTIKGSIENSTKIEFVKTYSGQGGVIHSVVYKGNLSGNKIEGTWSIPGSWSGKFSVDKE